jgi:hypothetical protein
MQEFLLIADAGWIKLIFVAVVFIIWIFNNLMGDKAKAKPRPMQRPMPPPKPTEGVPEAGRQAGQQPLVGEIEEFLQRANRKREEKARRKQGSKAPKVAKPAPVARQPARRLVDGGSESQQFEVTTGRSVAEHVQQHLNTSQFAERAAHMVDDDIAKNDAEREAHRRQVFDHKLGTLSDTSTGAAKAATEATAAARDIGAIPIGNLLANPDSLRQAIILNEILTRPEQRW